MQTNEAIRRLLAVGIHTVPAGRRLLRADDGTLVRVANLSRHPTPADIRNTLASLPPGEKVLFSVAKMTEALENAGFTDPRVIVVTPDRVLFDRHTELLTDPVQRSAPPGRGPRPYGVFAVARALLSLHRPALQTELATLTGVTQPSVSNALRRLASQDLVIRDDNGWKPASRHRLFYFAAKDYPGTGGITTYWWHDARLTEQAKLIRDATEDALLSGDLAATEINGWRIPELVVFYLREGLDPARLGFATADPGKHTLELTLPDDHTLWATAAAYDRPGLADPVTVYNDVLRTGTTGDEAEAAAKVRDTVVPRTT